MSPHPPIRNRPTALWRGAASANPRDPALLPYRPDWFARLGAAALADPALRTIAFRQPACALALLTTDPERTRARLEPALVGSGEAVFHYLAWSDARGLPTEPMLPAFRATLLYDGYWGYRHARRTGDTRLLAEVESWCADEKRRFGSAAALHLMRHPQEAVRPYRDLIAAHPFYAYLALPRLHPRGLRVRPADIGRDAKWAWHFALSRFSPEPAAFLPAILGDPGWAVEYATVHGWLSTPQQRVAWASRLSVTAAGHPLLPVATDFLTARAAVPAILASGLTEESRTLDALGRNKNKAVWRPTPEQIDSEPFRRIVGPPRYTDRGYARGTVVDSADRGFAEIKSGRSRLGPSYQLRLQAFRAVVEDQPLHIYTNRPVAEEFSRWLGPLGVKVEPLPDP